jgi:heptosyltransferase-2
LPQRQGLRTVARFCNRARRLVIDTAVIQVKPGIGDTIWHLPFLRTIAAASPGGQVIFFAPPSSHAAELLALEPSVAETVYFAHGGNELQRGLRMLRLAGLLRRYRFRRVWILDRTLRPAIAAWLAGIPERIGLGLGRQRLLITNDGIDDKHFHDFPIDWLKILMLKQNLSLVSTEPGLHVPDDALQAVDARFGSLPRPWLVVGLGASHPSKDWPDSHWLAFFRLLRGIDGTVFVVGGPKWQARAGRLLAESDSRAIDACDLQVMQSAALLKRADLYAGPDSGALNLAAAVGTEGIGLFGMTPSLRYTRFIHVLRADESSLAPLERIAPERLFAEVVSRLRAKAAAR